MEIRKKLLAVGMAAVLAFASASATALYSGSATFQGVTFGLTQIDGDSLRFEISGNTTGDWSTANFLSAFDFKDLGLDFGTVTAIANGPGAVNLHGLNDQLSASNLDCKSNASPPGSICFDVSPDVALGSRPFDLVYIIDFSSVLNILNTGPHLQIAFSAVQDGDKVGSLYSQNIPGGGGSVPEPGTLVLLGAGLIGFFGIRRKKA